MVYLRYRFWIWLVYKIHSWNTSKWIFLHFDWFLYSVSAHSFPSVSGQAYPFLYWYSRLILSYPTLKRNLTAPAHIYVLELCSRGLLRVRNQVHTYCVESYLSFALSSWSRLWFCRDCQPRSSVAFFIHLRMLCKLEYTDFVDVDISCLLWPCSLAL